LRSSGLIRSDMASPLQSYLTVADRSGDVFDIAQLPDQAL
jgi:hypothetical protein